MRLADWCVATGFPPQIHDGLSIAERKAFFESAKRIKRLK